MSHPFGKYRLVFLVFLLALLAATPSFAAGPETLAGAGHAKAQPSAENALPPSLAPVFPSADAQALPSNQEALRPRNASTGLSFAGNVAAITSNGNWRITADSITNTRNGGTSGTLRVALWATTSVPVFGNTITSYTLGSFTLNPLAGGFHYSNIDQTVAATNPPAGCYYLTLALQEFQSGSYAYVDLVTFTVGGTPDGSGYNRFSFGGSNCGSTGPCVQDATTACVLNGRFRATVRYRGVFDNQPADTNASRKPVTGFASAGFETAFFYFNSPNNIEMLLKILDQGNTNGQGQPTIAVLFGTASPLRVELTITDTTNGVTRTYASPFNSGQGGTDFTAFVK